jgi:hypothetical protein
MKNSFKKYLLDPVILFTVVSAAMLITIVVSTETYLKNVNFKVKKRYSKWHQD